jgi:hypothetical protein
MAAPYRTAIKLTALPVLRRAEAARTSAFTGIRRTAWRSRWTCTAPAHPNGAGLISVVSGGCQSNVEMAQIFAQAYPLLLKKG